MRLFWPQLFAPSPAALERPRRVEIRMTWAVHHSHILGFNTWNAKTRKSWVEIPPSLFKLLYCLNLIWIQWNCSWPLFFWCFKEATHFLLLIGVIPLHIDLTQQTWSGVPWIRRRGRGTWNASTQTTWRVDIVSSKHDWWGGGTTIKYISTPNVVMESVLASYFLYYSLVPTLGRYPCFTPANMGFRCQWQWPWPPSSNERLGFQSRYRAFYFGKGCVMGLEWTHRTYDIN